MKIKKALHAERLKGIYTSRRFRAPIFQWLLEGRLIVDDIEIARALLRSQNEGDQSAGKAMVERLFELGDPEARYAIGTWYLHGTNGYLKNETKGLDLIENAARACIPDACSDIAFAYRFGRGRQVNLKISFEYYILAAVQGDVEAIYSLAEFFEGGLGVASSDSAASMLYELYQKKWRH